MGPVRPDANRGVSSPSPVPDGRPEHGPPQRPVTTTDDHPGDPATHNDISEHSSSSSGNVPPPASSTDDDVPEGNREAVEAEVTIPPPASWPDDDVP
eukprot:6801376-Pyramimonas_sp.AAC.1